MSQTKWKRPENIPFPQTWSHFEGKIPINGKIPKFWIQDIPEDMFEIAVETMCKNYVYNEPLAKYSKLVEDPVSLEELKGLWKKLLQQKLGLICFMENPDKKGEKIIAGVNMTFISVKGDSPKTKFSGKKWLKVLDSVLYLCGLKDPYEMFQINEYMNGMGLSVLPEFRGQGIGEALLQARTPLCQAVGIKATLTVFSAIQSQILAERTGFKDIISITYEDLQKANPRFEFPGISGHTKNLRYMYKLL